MKNNVVLVGYPRFSGVLHSARSNLSVIHSSDHDNHLHIGQPKIQTPKEEYHFGGRIRCCQTHKTKYELSGQYTAEVREESVGGYTKMFQTPEESNKH